ncbi:MAG TPA: lamin tail domain-containing protein, partial [Verrucomicrobiae bacterium]|nr:lamin tail domain-containing protein [Verrucomicrobiae bacterium]
MKTSVLTLIFAALYFSIGNVFAQSGLESLTHRYSFSSDADDSIGAANGTLQGGAVVTNGTLVLDGVDSFVDLPNNILAGYNSVSIEVWLLDNGSGTWSRVWDFGNSTAGEGAAGTGNAYMFLTLQSGAGTVRGAFTPGTSTSEQIVEWNGHPTLGQLAHIVVTVNGTTHTASLYVNGVPVGSNNSFTLTPDAIGATLNDWIGRSQFSVDPFFNGAIDEFRIYNDALSPADVRADYQAGPDKILTGPVYFVREPSSQSVNAGETVTFNADVGGTPPISVLWYQNNQPMQGETNLTLSFPAVAGQDGFTYQLRASNTFNGNDYFVISSNATLSVEADNVPPSLVRAQSYSTNGVDVFFSEILRPDTATNIANYALTGPDGPVPVTSATLDSSGSIVTLATAPLRIGSNYVLSVSGVRDFSGNPVAPGSSTNFIATIYVLRDIGFPETTGTISGATNGTVLSGGGSGIGGASDQFTFGFQSRTGDFDVQVRLGALGLSDAWATAGLMARDTLATNAAFAASFATPGPAGCFFETRANSGAIAGQAGFFPVNYPDTWLRLKRAGNVFTGYASLDGNTWTQLGSATLALSSTVELGIALSSHNAAQNTTALISDNRETESATVANAPLPFEPIGPSSRRTGLVISEIMYHPKSAAGFGSLEFVEIYNSDLTFEDLSNYKLGGDIDYTFPPGTILPSGGYLVVARDPASVESFYGISGVLGPISGSLPNDHGTVRLINELGSVLLEVEYDSISPWPVSPDGAGHSLVLARPSYGENNARAWAASDVIGGSPGRGDSFGAEPLRGVLINEVLAHTDLPDLDSVELFNSTAQPLNLAGCVITDNPDVNRFTFGSVIIPARGFIYVTENDLGFRLNAAGETIFLKNPSGTRVLDAVRLEAQENGVSFGRFPDGNSEWYRLTAKTFGSANAAPRVSDVGINELMYHPISGSDDDQYVELYNHGTNVVDLGGWSFVSGIKFTFPTNTIISPGGYIVVAADKDRLLSNYPNLNSGNTVGNFSGHLSHSGE